MIVLGIDPGSRKTGFGLIEVKGNQVKYIHSETAKFDLKKDFLHRVPEIFEMTTAITEKYQPDCVSIESLIYVKSPTALIKLAQTRGIILSALANLGYEEKIFEYSPNLVKSATTGHGHTDKLGVQKFLNMVLGEREYTTDDESDALLIAMCHAFQHNKPKTNKKTGKGSLAQSVAHRI